MITILLAGLIGRIRDRQKFVKAGIIISCIPLALIALMLILGGADIAVVLVAVVAPFIIPAIFSGGFVGYIIGGRVLRDDNGTYYYTGPTDEPRRCHKSNRRNPDVIDTTFRYVEEDPYGRVKEMLWRANNPQPKDLPEVRR